MAPSWYVLRSKPNKEALLWDQLLIRKIETFYPFLKVKPVNPRSRKIKSYFPGYIFIHVDLDEIGFSTWNWLPGATGIVSFGAIPATVPDALIHAIKLRVEEINATGDEVFDVLKHGDVVEIQDGPFAGYEAIFDMRISGNDRVRVLLKLLQGKSAKVDIPANLLKVKKPN
jgi:transcription elongation factor/antiterminator RfaH